MATPFRLVLGLSSLLGWEGRITRLAQLAVCLADPSTALRLTAPRDISRLVQLLGSS